MHQLQAGETISQSRAQEIFAFQEEITKFQCAPFRLAPPSMQVVALPILSVEESQWPVFFRGCLKLFLL
jgi:hypothetical protein